MHASGDGWYVYRVEGVDTASLVFHDQHGRQTADLHRERDGWMDRDGQWRDAGPGPLVPPQRPAPQPRQGGCPPRRPRRRGWISVRRPSTS